MRVFSILPALLLAVGTPALAAASLPNGASSLTEAHGSWTVACGIRGEGAAAAVVCEVTQRQASKATQQQVLAIDLTPVGGAAKGVLALPLGMALAKGVVLQVDAANSTPVQAYSTCVATGCIVPLNFDAPNLKLLRAGKTLNVYATAIGDKPFKLAIPLDGLPAALDRATALLGKN